nr:MAG TPA: hypothetical protein [Caudoviricetes sp.]
MDIKKLKKEFKRSAELKTKIKEMDNRYREKYGSLKLMLPDLLSQWKDSIRKEIDAFFCLHGFIKDNGMMRYTSGDGYLQIKIDADMLPIKVEVRKCGDIAGKIIEVKPYQNVDEFYYGEMPGEKIYINDGTRMVPFTIYNVEYIHDAEDMERIIEAYEEILMKLEHTLAFVSEGGPFAYYLKNKQGYETGCVTFAEVFEKL